jgi:hypothetical protein
MAGKEQYTVEQIVKAIREGHTPQGASYILGCHSDTVRNYARRYPTVKAALTSERRDLFDLAENSLRRAVLNGESWAVSMVIKTLGKDDGYTERSEVTGADGGPIENKNVVEIRAVDYRNVAANLAPGPVPDSDAPGESENSFDGSQVG